MMNIEKTKKSLEKWADAIVKDAKANAAREFGSDSNLAANLGRDVKVGKNWIKISFFPGYATFPDLGVRGNKGILKDGRRSSPYQYRDKMPPTSALDTFVLKKLKGLIDEMKLGYEDEKISMSKEIEKLSAQPAACKSLCKSFLHISMFTWNSSG